MAADETSNILIPDMEKFSGKLKMDLGKNCPKCNPSIKLRKGRV